MALVDHWGDIDDALTASTKVATVPHTIPAGTFVAISVGMNAGTTTVSAVDSRSNTWVSAGASVVNGANSVTGAMLTSVLTTTLQAADTITFTLGASRLRFIVSVGEFDDVLSTTQDGARATGTGTSVTPSAGPTGDPATTRALVLMAGACQSTSTGITGAGVQTTAHYEREGTSSGERSSFLTYAYVNTPGTQTPSGTLSTSVIWVAQAVCFDAAVSGLSGTSVTAAETVTLTSTGVTGAVTGGSLAETVTAASTGLVGKVAGAALALTVGLTATGVVGESTGGSLANTVTLSATGSVTAGLSGTSVTAAETVSLSSSGVVGATTGASLATTVTLDATGVVGKVSGSSLAVTSTLASTGTVTSGLSQGSSLAETVSLTSAGVVGKSTGSSLAETISLTSTGAVGKTTGGSVAETVTLAAAGTVGAATGGSRTVTLTFSADGVVGVSSGATLATTLDLSAAGIAVAPGAAEEGSSSNHPTPGPHADDHPWVAAKAVPGSGGGPHSVRYVVTGPTARGI